MLVLKHYKRPLGCITISGEKVRITPGLLAKFSKPLADKRINIYAVSTGEYSVSFFVDEKEVDMAVLLLTELVSKSAFDGIAIRKNIGMVSITGPELVNTPGLLHKLLTPLAKEKINILTITTSFDSDLIFFDYGDAEKAFKILNNYIPEKISIFKKAKEKAKEVLRKIIKK